MNEEIPLALQTDEVLRQETIEKNERIFEENIKKSKLEKIIHEIKNDQMEDHELVKQQNQM